MKGMFWLLLCCLSVSLNVPGATNDTADRKHQTEAQLTTVNTSIQRLKTLQQSINKKRSASEVTLQKLESNILQTQQDLDRINGQLSKGETELASLQQRQVKLLVRKKKDQGKIASSLRSMYLMNGNSRVQMLLNHEDPDELLRYQVYLEYIQAAQMKEVRSYEHMLNELDTLRHDKTQKVAQLKFGYEALLQRQNKLVQQQKERQKIVKQLEKDRIHSTQQLNSLAQQQKSLQALLARLNSAVSGQPMRKLRGKLPWPLKGDLLFRFNEYGKSSRLKHQGILIRAAEGSAVRAVYGGKVIFADWLRGYGLLAIVDHGNNYLTLYAHNQSILKREGGTVKSGEIIAKSGNTGGMSTPGLYFELRHKGIPENPLSWLVSR
ncbi:Murein hydrolase activator EnvC [invertebrate metagenome]|uniref:Murein hydrolase activator EnvC n=1 Tax=invertebrate metagenome TaxID=1711999 RepID=A0A2H9T9W1_9ZZZZ